MNMLTELESELNLLTNNEKGIFLQRFFKTGPGQYGEGDVFIGLSVPQSRSLAKKYRSLSFDDLKMLLQSPIHEKRLIALLILVEQFQKGDLDRQKKVYDFYMQQVASVNNWDLVDLSADKIVGAHLYNSAKDGEQFIDRSILYTLAHSKNLWERRISIVSTYHFIKHNDLEDTFKIAEILLHDNHDLIHKAVGWMLREAGKRNQGREEAFLKKHYKTMPRTMLRYAIEKFDEPKRKAYLKGKA